MASRCVNCKGTGMVQTGPGERGLKLCPFCNGTGTVEGEKESYLKQRNIWVKVMRLTRDRFNTPIQEDVYLFTYRQVVILKYALHLLNEKFYDGSDLTEILDHLKRASRNAQTRYRNAKKEKENGNVCE